MYTDTAYIPAACIPLLFINPYFNHVVYGTLQHIFKSRPESLTTTINSKSILVTMSPSSLHTIKPLNYEIKFYDTHRSFCTYLLLHRYLIVGFGKQIGIRLLKQSRVVARSCDKKCRQSRVAATGDNATAMVFSGVDCTEGSWDERNRGENDFDSFLL